MHNMNGEELLTYMLVLDCKHVVPRGPMPTWIGDLTCMQSAGTDAWCDDCTATAERSARDLLPYRAASPVSRTVIRAGLWDWAVWEQKRDERWREQHLASLAHAMGWCPCEAADAGGA